MGIVNVTPDSFSDGGRHSTTSAALAHCEQLLKDGADMLDIGGESTRPGAPPVSLEEELARVLPVVAGAVKLGVPVSVDTYKPEVMQAVLDTGADIINDVWALQRGRGLQVIAAHPNCGICLMHMHLEPQTMQIAPMGGDAVDQVRTFLRERAAVLVAAGVAPARIALDVGIGFGKTVEQNFDLLAAQAGLLDEGMPWCMPWVVGWSRKSSLGAVTGRTEPAERVAASVAAALLALERGAHVARVHDVRETVDAINVWQALRGRGPRGTA